jgi:hypothetical protein
MHRSARDAAHVLVLRDGSRQRHPASHSKPRACRLRVAPPCLGPHGMQLEIPAPLRRVERHLRNDLVVLRQHEIFKAYAFCAAVAPGHGQVDGDA